MTVTFVIVTPRAGVWVEIPRMQAPEPTRQVTPRAGVWVEINEKEARNEAKYVTPRAGVWVEIIHEGQDRSVEGVTPRAGVWVEIDEYEDEFIRKSSLPVRECGLKFRKQHRLKKVNRHSPCGSVG